jgi:hypothetical protein
MDHRCVIRKVEETAMDKQPSGREEYVRKLLEAYRNTPGPCGNLRRPDRMLAVQLYQRGVPLQTVENALVLAAVRRMIRPADAPPLTTVRSLAYFMPVIEEVIEMEVGERVFRIPATNPSTPTLFLTPHPERDPQPRLRRGMTLKSKTRPHLRAG